MRVFGTSIRLLGTGLSVVVAAGLCACDSDGEKSGSSATEQAHAAADSLSGERSAIVADLQDRIVFLLSTLPNAPTASVYGGRPGDTTLTVSIPNDTNHAAARAVLQSATMVRQLRSVGYRAVSFLDAGSGGMVVLPLPDPSATELIASAPTGAQGEAARRAFADSLSVRLRAVGSDARARGADREVLYLDGLSGSANVALGYANAVAGGVLTFERLKALRFDRLVVAARGGLWCWNMAELSGPTPCSATDPAVLR
jgi:hypothetical protein